MRALTQVIARVLTFRAGGEVMPHAPRLLLVLLCAALAMEVMFALLFSETPINPFWILVRISVGQGLLWLLLQGARKRERFVQTSIALTISTLIYSIVIIPLMLPLLPYLPLLKSSPEKVPAFAAGFVFLAFPITIWFMVLRASIFRGATEYRWVISFLVSMALPFTEAVITISLMKMFGIEGA
jgi:hypothetical protein